MATSVAVAPAAQAARLTGPTLSGSVVSNGVGLAGASVQEYAWPTSVELLEPGKGKPIKMLSLGTATTGADGSYSVPSQLASLPSDYRLADGTVNLQTYVITRSGQWAQTQVAIPDTEATSVKAGVINSVRWDMARGTILDSNGIHQAAHPGTAQRLTVSRMSASAMKAMSTPAKPNGNLPYSCVWYDTGGPVALHHEIYGKQTGSPNVWGWISENTSHSNTLELATYEGARGWTADYSAGVTITGSGTATTARHGYTDQHLNSIDMKEYKCFTYYNGLYQYPGVYEWRPILMAGMNSQERHISPDWQSAYCQHASAGDTQNQGKGITTTTSGGMSVMGVSLTVTNTFTTSWESNFLWVTSGEFCGNNYLGVSVSSDIEGDEYYHS